VCIVVLLTSFVMCKCMWRCSDNRVSVLVIRVLVFNVFSIVCTVFLYYFVYVYSYLFCLC